MKKDTKQEVLEVFRKITLKKNHFATVSEMLLEGKVDRHLIRYHYGSHSGLVRAYKVAYPKEAAGLFSSGSLFSGRRYREIKKEIANNRVFIISTAESNAEVDQGFLAAMGTFCKARKGMRLFLPAGNKTNGTGTWKFDEVLDNEHMIFQDTSLNQAVHLSAVRLNTKQIDPTTGLNRFGNKEGSFIYAATKQRLRPVPVQKSKLAKVIMTTGAVTKPRYSSKTFYNDRTAYIAKKDHIIGAIIVEIVDGKRFFFRQVQADRDGSFIDLGTKYCPNGQTERIDAAAVVLGDVHAGETDPVAGRASREMVDLLRPKFTILHDLFNGSSISPHEQNQEIVLAQKAEAEELHLDDELRVTSQVLNEINSWKTEKTVVVKSNHDEWLYRYVNNGLFYQRRDYHNHRVAHQLALAVLDGVDPLKWGCENVGQVNDPDKVIWLEADADFKVAGIQCGSHGHNGNNGARGSLAALELALTNSFSGHTHKAEILRGAWSVGTLTHLDLPYKKGGTSWTQTNGVIYPNGSRQLIFIVDGRWRL